MTPLSSPLLNRKTSVLGEDESVCDIKWDIYFSFSAADELRCWLSAERTAGREKNQELSLSPWRPWVCLP